ncbi:HNH endonuclease [Viridibacillus arvi]|uniref:HNH endonuclease n=1 Tax=Viridibacillus arvi TaxID=263475 RepID=UPI003D065443
MKINNVKDLLAVVPKEQKEAMDYFIRNHQAKEVKYESKYNGISLHSPALGIYKPGYSDYVLSVKETLKGHYPDQPIYTAEDGKCFYLYHQQGETLEEHTTLNANVALNRNIKNKVPVGVSIQQEGKGRSGSTYNIYVSLVIGWVEGFYILYFADDNGDFDIDVYKLNIHDIYNSIMDQGQTTKLEENNEFDPGSIADARKKIQRSIIQRQGQPKFRQELLTAYEEKCVITECNVLEVLEAAHIVPYQGTETNVVQNGLLLRGDIHTLWDRYLISVNPDTYKVHVHTSLMDSEYAQYEGKKVSLPTLEMEKPSYKALLNHHEEFRKSNNNF